MAETLYTPDGKVHVLVGSTTLESIVREYAGDDTAERVRAEIERNTYDEARAETDLGAYEVSLEHWHSMARDWIADLDTLICLLGRRSHGITKAHAITELDRLKAAIEKEL